MTQQSSPETVTIQHELDLGQHTLFLLSDDSMDLLAHHEHTSSHANNGMSLNSDETYRLFISLQEQFHQRSIANGTRISRTE